MNSCKHCGARILWAFTEKGHRICYDPVPHPNGNLVIVEVDLQSVPTVHVLTKIEAEVERRQRFLPHKATCGGKPRPPERPLRPLPEQDHLVLD